MMAVLKKNSYQRTSTVSAFPMTEEEIAQNFSEEQRKEIDQHDHRMSAWLMPRLDESERKLKTTIDQLLAMCKGFYWIIDGQHR
jgi:hypothetical protein